jgi:D-aminopeptidase
VAAQELIYQAAWRGVVRLKDGQAPQPFRVAEPVRLRVDFVQSEMADKAAILPGARRPQERQVEFTGSSILDVYAAFRALLGLARA